ncbi:ABC transporter permease subunit [Planosporangium thailandense]|uniref:ABC transporter permease subunit n=2 Tax=Planosporangium thailandense TaxID=765197 RepID=A0ABX0XQE9_9ACTN|nr:ABC transporter permease subunit [Planosporangium thailandense]
MGRRVGVGRLAMLLLSPSVLVLLLVIGYPIVSALRLSFIKSTEGIDPNTGLITRTSSFSLDNYTNIFKGESGDLFWNAFWNTTTFTVVTVAIETVVGICMALIMNNAFRGRGLVRASILVPWAIPTAISGLLWRWIFTAQGVANDVLHAHVLWTTEGIQSWLAVVIADTWKTAPFIGLLVLAGLQIIPAEVYEAAKMDGATPWVTFWRITLPLVKPALVVAVLFRMLDVLRMFDLPFVLIGRGKSSTDTLSILAYNEMDNLHFGPAAAYATVLFLYVAIVAYVFVRLLGADIVGRGVGGEDQVSQTTPAAAVATAPVARNAAIGGGQRRRRRGASWLYYVGIAAIVVYCLAPFYWMVVSALRRPNDQFSNAPLPMPLSLKNLEAAFSSTNGFGRALLNSVIVAGATTVVTLVLGISAAYALARLDFRGKGFLLSVIIATSMFPGIAVVVPIRQLFVNINWINTYQAMVLPSLSFALPLSIWLLTAFFRQMPFELEEAAQIDGCTPSQAFRRIILPIAAPGVFTTAILVFISAWNEFIIAVSVVNKSEYKTANVIVSQFTGQYQFDQPFGTQMAAGVVVTIPLVIAVLLFQRRIVEGLTAGGVK